MHGELVALGFVCAGAYIYIYIYKNRRQNDE